MRERTLLLCVISVTGFCFNVTVKREGEREVEEEEKEESGGGEKHVGGGDERCVCVSVKESYCYIFTMLAFVLTILTVKRENGEEKTDGC